MYELTYWAISQGVTSIILLILYLVTYIKLQVGSKYPLITRLTLLLLVSNFFMLLLIPAEIKIYLFDKTKEGKNMYLWVIEQGICYICKDISFNLAHLDFAFEYYKIAKFMPIVLLEQ